MTDRPSTAKRSPSILVTDVRQGQKSAPFVRKGQPGNQQGGQQGQGRFNDISIDNILSDVSEIPSAQRRLAPALRGGDLLRRRGSAQAGSTNVAGADKGKAPLIGAGARTHHLGGKQPQTELNAGGLKQARSAGSGGQRSVSGPTSTRLSSQRQRRNSLPPRMAPGLPSRTTKMSERLVLIPEEGAPNFRFEDEDEDRPPLDEELGGDIDAFAKRSYAERVPKDKRTEKFPRVTAYCISDAVRLKAAADYLRDHHKIKPRIYDEALFAPYYLPLLPGDEDGYSRVQSSPGGIQMLETLINRSEQDDHHYEYYSGLESSSNTNEISATAHDDENEEFDPSEPQDFSPQDRRGGEYMERHVNGSDEGHHHEHNEEEEALHKEDHDSRQHEESVDEGQHNENEDKETAKAPDDLRHAEIFIFSYGVIVFWNFTEKQEKDILADMTFGRGQDAKPLVIRPIDDQDIETEDLHFTYSPETHKPRIYNDMITLKSGDHMIKLAMSHAIAQSTKLSRFEARMDLNMHDVKHVPKMLALTGKLGMKREEILKMSGKLFKLRVDVNLSSNVLDTPEFFWEAEPSLNPMYSALREYLEIEPRILVLNERCKTFLELTDIIADSIAESNMARITWVIIILIALSLGVSTIEILIRFTILKENVNS